MQPFYETTVRVRYAETDRMGFAYHANFFVWFEVGRVELCRQLGFAYKEMEERDDTYIVVAEARCTFKRPAHYDQALRVRTRIAESRSRAIRFAYEIVDDPSGESLATGETLHVLCDGKGRPKVLPAKYRKFFPLLRLEHCGSGATRDGKHAAAHRVEP
jgi:acyl-CoA thioester hydrolase